MPGSNAMTVVHRIQELLRSPRPHDAHLRFALELRAMPDQDAVRRTLKHHTDHHPSDKLARVLHIQALGWAGRTTDAEQALFELLGADNSPVLDHLQKRILDRGGRPNDTVRSEYICFPASMVQNLGFWTHRISSPDGRVREAITKVMHKDHCGRETAFYARIRDRHPALAMISPEPIDLTTVDACDIVLLTMERFHGNVADPDAMDQEAVSYFVREYAALAAIPHAAIAHEFTDKVTENGLSHGYLASSLHLVHTPHGFEQTVEWTSRTVAARGYRADVIDRVQRAMEHLVRCNFATHVHPAEHYALLHGDMHRHNVLVLPTRTVLIDWARCTTGPRGIDLAVLFRRYGYQRVCELLQEICALDEVSDVLLAWALIIVSLELDLPGIKSEPSEHLFIPAASAILAYRP